MNETSEYVFWLNKIKDFRLMVFVFPVMKIKSRTSYMLSKHPATQVHPAPNNRLLNNPMIKELSKKINTMNYMKKATFLLHGTQITVLRGKIVIPKWIY